MRVLAGDHRTWEPLPAPTALTIGVFDGVHRGHRHVLDEVHRRGDGLDRAVLTFDRHPLAVVAPDQAPAMLTTVAQRLELLAAAGIDVTGVLAFDDGLRGLPAAGFVERLVAGVFRAEVVVVGEDFRFGRGREGDVDLLAREGRRYGFDVVGLELLGETAPVSSTAIRRAVRAGEVAAAADALGHPYQLRGTVVAGDGRGRRIGVPTANLDLPDGIVMPADGVYAARAGVDGERGPAVVNVGVRPTFDGRSRVVEVHLMGVDVDLYGRELEVDFVERVRDERRFDDVAALVAQIEADVATAAALLGDTDPLRPGA
jgi:riboflavin kinase / FMN adenylyltransferase